MLPVQYDSETDSEEEGGGGEGGRGGGREEFGKSGVASGAGVEVKREVDEESKGPVEEVHPRVARFEELAERGIFFFDKLLERREHGNLGQQDASMEGMGLDAVEATKMAPFPGWNSADGLPKLDVLLSRSELAEKARKEHYRTNPHLLPPFVETSSTSLSSQSHKPPAKAPRVDTVAAAIEKAKLAAKRIAERRERKE